MSRHAPLKNLSSIMDTTRGVSPYVFCHVPRVSPRLASRSVGALSHEAHAFMQAGLPGIR